MVLQQNQLSSFDKRRLELVFSEQKAELDSKRHLSLCPRQEEQFIDLHSPQAQVVIGVRRSGKSTLCFQALERAGVNYAYADFDDERLVGLNASSLNDVLEVLYKVYGDFNYLFFDEIQDVNGWHLFVNRLLRQRMHVIVTGSNAKLLSGELATHLSGRAKEIRLYPFSFSEYCSMRKVDTITLTTKAEAFRRAAFDDYMREGGFPELLDLTDSRAYVRDLVDNILRRDIEQRYKIAYKETFEQLAHHLLNVSPVPVVTAKLARDFRFKSEHTVKNYVSYLRQAFLLVGIKKFSFKSKLRVTQEKVYPVDVAMMNRRANAFASVNLGWRLETLVLLHLLRLSQANGYDVYYLFERSYECDFLLCDGSDVLLAVQVAYDITNEKTLKRELNGLLLAAKMTHCDNLLLITDHDRADFHIDNRHISVLPFFEWTLRNPS